MRLDVPYLLSDHICYLAGVYSRWAESLARDYISTGRKLCRGEGKPRFHWIRESGIMTVRGGFNISGPRQSIARAFYIVPRWSSRAAFPHLSDLRSHQVPPKDPKGMCDIISYGLESRPHDYPIRDHNADLFAHRNCIALEVCCRVVARHVLKDLPPRNSPKRLEARGGMWVQWNR